VGIAPTGKSTSVTAHQNIWAENRRQPANTDWPSFASDFWPLTILLCFSAVKFDADQGFRVFRGYLFLQYANESKPRIIRMTRIRFQAAGRLTVRNNAHGYPVNSTQGNTADTLQKHVVIRGIATPSVGLSFVFRSRNCTRLETARCFSNSRN
jgi:hypothetical protein